MTGADLTHELRAAVEALTDAQHEDLVLAGVDRLDIGLGMVGAAYGHVVGDDDHDDPEPNSKIKANGLPTITVLAGARHQAADEGLAALYKAGVAFYRRGRDLVRVCRIAAKTSDGEETTTPGIIPVTLPILMRELGRAACWEAYNRKGELHPIDPPKAVAEQIAGMIGDWRFPLLAGVIGTPTMRPDGTLLLTEGYDKSTGLVLLGAPVMPPISAEATKEDATRALEQLDSLLAEFPFRDGGGPESVDRAVALSMLLTPVLRGAMPAAPMHLGSAPEAGSGKSYLADLASAIAIGERCAVIAFSPDPRETEKRLNGAALEGPPIIGIDNITDTVESDLLCQLTERPLLKLRPLGTSNQPIVSNSFTVLANGNNVVIAADMVRRTIVTYLDANTEEPENRFFTGNPLKQIQTNRGRYIAAALTIARAYLCGGRPGRLPPIASYETWSDIVRSPLVWLGRGDPAASTASLRRTDPIRQARTALFSAWTEELHLGGSYYTAEIVKLANEKDSDDFRRPALRAAALDIAPGRRGEIDPRALGKWLGKAENSVAAGLKLTCNRNDATRPKWMLNTTNANEERM